MPIIEAVALVVVLAFGSTMLVRQYFSGEFGNEDRTADNVIPLEFRACSTAQSPDGLEEHLAPETQILNGDPLVVPMDRHRLVLLQ